MVDLDHRHQSRLLQLHTVNEESETEEDDVRSNSSTLKSSSERRGWTGQQGVVVMTESTDSGLESDKNELTTNDSDGRRRRHESWLYHCQASRRSLSLSDCLSVVLVRYYTIR